MFALTFSLPAANAQQESQLDVAFLEYLAELENVDGRWVGALDLLESEGDNSATGKSSQAPKESDATQSELNGPLGSAQGASSSKQRTDKGAQG